jgi:hypothetical protein
MDQKKAGREQD